ncbi:hypothetical protein [Pseudomonas sp. NPDC089534]|uniref:hypothetical protein n=1 Tax=Pseudomonas sp. NPDC089534 TaxID=3364468 RepID=UPI0038118497
MDSKLYLAHNIDQKTLRAGNARAVTNNVFIVDFNPPFPLMENPFIAAQFIYASLTEGNFSLIGRIPLPEIFTQFSFVFPCSIEDGTHQIGSDSVRSSIFISHAGIIHLEKGEITLKRDKVQNTLEAIFSVYIKYRHDLGEEVEYHAEGRVFVNATGPLCAES